MPLYLGDNIEIESIFKIGKSKKNNIKSKFIRTDKNVATTADVNLVLVKKNNFSIVKKRPDFLSTAFLKLSS